MSTNKEEQIKKLIKKNIAAAECRILSIMKHGVPCHISTEHVNVSTEYLYHRCDKYEVSRPVDEASSFYGEENDIAELIMSALFKHIESVARWMASAKAYQDLYIDAPLAMDVTGRMVYFDKDSKNIIGPIECHNFHVTLVKTRENNKLNFYIATAYPQP